MLETQHVSGLRPTSLTFSDLFPSIKVMLFPKGRRFSSMFVSAANTILPRFLIVKGGIMHDPGEYVLHPK
jgi:hypothetical protein